MTEERRQAGAGYTGYEYREISVPREYVSLCLDSYPCFGWEEDPNYEQPGRRGVHARSRGAGEKDAVTLYFRRVRSIRSKVELTRLQRNFDSCVAELKALEQAKRTQGMIAALTVGILGTGAIVAFEVTCDGIGAIGKLHAAVCTAVAHGNGSSIQLCQVGKNPRRGKCDECRSRSRQ